MMNIKENCYIYDFNKLKKLIGEQKYTKEGTNWNSMFDIIHQYMPKQTSQGIKV
jgi:hypothetical protein